MSDTNDGTSETRPLDELGRAGPRADHASGIRVPGRVPAFIIGLVIVLAGLACVAEAAMNLDDMMRASRVVHVPRTTLSERAGFTLKGGFGVGVLAFLGMLFVGVGTGLVSVSATTSPSTRRRVTAILALAWHGVGVGFGGCYCALAPTLDVWPFLLVTAYLWLGLVPLALAIPDGERTGGLRSAVWYAMGGGFLGGFAGAVIGGVVGGVAVVLSYAVGSGVVGTTWWLYASMGGGLATGVVFALRRLMGWEISSGNGKKEEGDEECDEEKRKEPQTPRSAVCRKCRTPVEFGREECSYCGAPMQARRSWPIARMFTGVGFACVVGTVFGLGLVQNWLIGKGFHPTVLSYLFWVMFLGGGIMIGIGSLLNSAKPVRGFRGDSGSTDESEGETEPSGEVPYSDDVH